MELYVTPAKDILEQALRNAASINDVLVAFRDDKGDIGFVTNLADSTESIAFTNRLLWKILKHEHDIDNGDVPPTSA